MRIALRRPVVLLSTLLLLSTITHAAGRDWDKGLASITAEELYHHLLVLADDSMKGRNTPSPELKKAADYITSQFISYGLATAPGLSGYAQFFNLLRVRLSEPNHLIFRGERGEISCNLKSDFVPLPLSANGEIDAPVFFVGYGITAPEYGYDDYADIDVTGKIALMFTHEPRERDTCEVFLGRRATDHSKPLLKALNAQDHGAVAIILVNDPLHHRARRPPNPWPSLMRHPPQNGVPLRLEESPSESILGVHIGRRVAQSLFAASGQAMAAIQSQIDSTLRPHSFPLPWTAHIKVTLDADREPVRNVVGFLPGSDPQLASQVVVIGAHYDHVGTRSDTIIYNGSDDNASGTSGVLELAQAFALNPIRPKRSLLFITFAGEEKGLFGSRFYAANPILPLDSTVAMINLDMISRNDSNKVSIGGSSVSPELIEAVSSADEEIGLEITKEADRHFRQSDHYSFYRKGVPVLFFNTLDHEDLHRPTDDPEKAIPSKMEKITRLVYLTAWKVANSRSRPSYHEFAAQPTGTEQSTR